VKIYPDLLFSKFQRNFDRFNNLQGNNVKENILIRGAFVALLLTNTMAMAESDYPATNFKPVIVFQDQDANESSKKNESAAPTKSKSVEATKTDSSSKVDVSEEDSSDAVAVKPETATKDEKSNTNVLIGLGVVVAAGVFFFTRKKGGSAKEAINTRSGGLTGVERYLQNRSATAGTGVARYLDKKASALKQKAESTGVSKYLKEKSQNQRVAASSEVSPRGTVGGATGVAKYLRDKG
jgi:hypothetical protein